MAPEHEALPRAFYDHEGDEPHRRRRVAADWGVGEDIFDRMPSRRFTRADRRGEHHEDDARRAEPRRGDETPRRAAVGWAEDVPLRRGEDAERREAAGWDEDTPRRRG